MADNSAPKKRPKPRDVLLGAKIDPDLADEARKRAVAEGRSISAIIRSFLRVWVDDEYPSPPIMPDETTRAKKRRRKKKK